MKRPSQGRNSEPLHVYEQRLGHSNTANGPDHRKGESEKQSSSGAHRIPTSAWPQPVGGNGTKGVEQCSLSAWLLDAQDRGRPADRKKQYSPTPRKQAGAHGVRHESKGVAT